MFDQINSQHNKKVFRKLFQPTTVGFHARILNEQSAESFCLILGRCLIPTVRSAGLPYSAGQLVHRILLKTRSHPSSFMNDYRHNRSTQHSGDYLFALLLDFDCSLRPVNTSTPSSSYSGAAGIALPLVWSFQVPMIKMETRRDGLQQRTLQKKQELLHF